MDLVDMGNNNLVRRLVIFVLSWVCLSINLTYLFAIRDPKDEFLTWTLYITHLSNLAFAIWSFFALISYFLKDKKIDEIIHSWYIKGAIGTSIILIGILYTLFAYYPQVIHVIIVGEKEDLAWYATSQTCQHVINPALMLWEIIAFGGVTKINVESKKFYYSKYIAINLIIYFIYVMLITNLTDRVIYYPNLDFKNHVGEPWFITLSMIANLFILFIYALISEAIIFWSKRKKRGNKT